MSPLTTPLSHSPDFGGLDDPDLDHDSNGGKRIRTFGERELPNEISNK